MWLEIYLFLWSIGIIFSILSLCLKAKRVGLLFPFLSAFFFFFAGINSYSIEKTFCELNTADSWTCYTVLKIDPGMGWLGVGLGMVMLIFAIVNAVTIPAEMIERG